MYESICLTSKKARDFIPRLIVRGCWFQVTPLPNDLFRISTKAEGHFTREGVSKIEILKKENP